MTTTNVMAGNFDLAFQKTFILINVYKKYFERDTINFSKCMAVASA